MKKFTKIIALTIVAVMLVTMLTGCALFGKDTAKYRALPVLKVGNEEITLGRVIDLFNTYYSNYQYYIQMGYMTYEGVFQETLASIYSTYMKVDAYKTASDVVTYTSAENKYVNTYSDAKYLTQTEMETMIKSVKYNLFAGLDAYVESYITIEIGDLATLDETTGREFYEYDDMTGFATYAEMTYENNVKDEEADKYFEKYPLVNADDMYVANVDSYVLTAGNTTERVNNINERLAKYVEDNEEEGTEAPVITEEEYINLQERALRKYTQAVDKNYGMTLAELFVYQVESYIDSVVAMKYDLKISKEVELSPTFAQEIENSFYDNVNAKNADYAMTPSSFESFVSGLTNESVIFAVPEQYVSSYIYVKNLLIPFSETQTQTLANYAAIVGSKTCDEYVTFRDQLAAQIVAKDFNNDEAEVQGVFAYENGEVKLAGALAAAFPQSGPIATQTFVDLMAQYNTDTASHANIYDYVVRVGYTPSSFTHSWVTEFVDAANTAYNEGNNPVGSYAIAVSDYGVHVVMYSGKVVAATFDANNMYNTQSVEYTFMKGIYQTKVSYLSGKDLDDLQDAYMYAEDRKIEKTSYFNQLLKILDIEYDFEEAMKDPDLED